MNESVNCTKCGCTLLIDTSKAGHGTIINSDKIPNKIQCTCGKYIF